MASLPLHIFVRPGFLSGHTALLALLLCSGASLAAAPAPTDPFLRAGPAAQPPVLSGPDQAPPLPGSGYTPSYPATQSAAQSSATVVSATAFGLPRFSSGGGVTRVVFDLPAGLRYALTPTFSGLRIDVQAGAGQTRTLAARHLVSPGSAVSDYTLTPDPSGGGLALLQTPFPLGGSQGWTATETTIASGGRVLILVLGAALEGGADGSVTGSVQAIAGPPAPSGTPSVAAQQGTAQSGAAQSGAAQSGSAGAVLSSQDQLPPGDTSPPPNSVPLPTATPALAGSADRSRLTIGVVSGTSAGTPTVAAPRIGKNPGLTRVVLDLPDGTGFRVTPLPLGLRIDLTGVSAQRLGSQFGSGQSSLTPELRAWNFTSNLTGVSLTLVTSSPITLRSGWRDVLLPASPGQLSRLAIDLSPALADTTPLGPLALAPLKSSRSSMLAFSGAANRPKVVIDPGHGGSDPGAIGQVVEKEVTLAVARRVRADLNAAGIDVLMTRDSDTQLAASKNTDLAMRAALGTGVAQLFVSIHVNSTEASSALKGYGIETWWNPNNPNSQALAQNIQQDAVAATAAYSRGLKNTHSLAVLRQSRIPAALVEIGYTSHPVDGQNLADSNYLDRVAYGVASGIRDALQTGLGTTWR
ncbi:N-acetylmuramoyl-L-alanine amidase [Deinococcus altitudinis]|uniref:N-acetylmuramoyl-L-alanine amidase n=1 Tax=Deinococcus altitudinis TaxID=468914 RepID=UPI00389170A2